MHARRIEWQFQPWVLGPLLRRTLFPLIVLTLWLLAAGYVRADGCFVFVWDKQRDINEPTQKAIVLHDRGREDLVLQVKYEGPAQDFGWLVPVPGLPEVHQGSMDCFYELSRLTQEHWPEATHGARAGMATLAGGRDEAVKVIEVKTVGAYEVAVLASTNATSLTEWLAANQFSFPTNKQSVLDSYIRKGWYFVAARINPEGTGFALKSAPPRKPRISHATRKKLAKGELHPLVLSFPSEKCVFPLAISAVNGKPSEVSLYVLSAEPLMSRVIFEQQFAAYRRERAQWVQGRPERQQVVLENLQRMEALRQGYALRAPRTADPADPPPAPEVMQQLSPAGRHGELFPEMDDEYYAPQELVRSLEVKPEELPSTTKALPRLAGKSWWLTKAVQTFAPEAMRDLEFEPAVPLLAAHLNTPDGLGPARALAQFGPHAFPVVLRALQSSDPTERRLALCALTAGTYADWHASRASGRVDTQVATDPRLTTVLTQLLAEPDARTRAKACEATLVHWDAGFTPLLVHLLEDDSAQVRWAACTALQPHREELQAQLPALLRLLDQDGPAAPFAARLYVSSGTAIPGDKLPHLLASTNVPVLSVALSQLRGNYELNQLEPLLTNSLPMARLMGLTALTQIGDNAAVDRIVHMLRDSNEVVRWRVRSSLRQLSGQKLGADPAAWEHWWARNNATFTPQPLPRSRWPRE